MSTANNNTKKKALGRGLSALLQNGETDITTSSAPINAGNTLAGSIPMLDIDQIEANPFQPRTKFEEEALAELRDSIKEHGIIQPVTVRKLGYDKYQLISGERRFRASQLAGLKQIPAYIRIANDQSMLEMALVENIQRENLDAIEIAISYQRLMDECNLTQEQLSDKVAKQRSTVTNYLRLLKLPAVIQMAIRENIITMGHARALINIADKDKQIELYQIIVENELSVRATEELVRGEKPKSVGEIKDELKDKQRTTSAPILSTDHIKVENNLREFFSTDVQLNIGKNGKGKIVVPFNSEQDLKIILEMLNLDEE
jgi:ParB family chromosome partitioning protein